MAKTFYLLKKNQLNRDSYHTDNSLTQFLWQFRGIRNKCKKSEIRFFKEDDPLCRFWKGYDMVSRIKKGTAKGIGVNLKKEGEGVKWVSGLT